MDRLREDVEVLDEEIAVARKFAKPQKGSESQVSLQWAKTLRDLVELRNATLDKIKLNLLGRDREFGLPNEPSSLYDSDAQITFERDFKNFLLLPWKESDLRLKCEECHRSSEQVEYRDLDEYDHEDEYMCDSCYEKFKSERNKDESESETHEE